VAAAIPLGLALGRWLARLILTSSHEERVRLPLVVAPATDAFAVLFALGAAGASGWVLRRHLDRLDLVAALKARE
jgi:putative ABC transport system permease protein